MTKKYSPEIVQKYAELAQLMRTFKKGGSTLTEYKKFLKVKNQLTDRANAGDTKAHQRLLELGFYADTVTAPSFGTKTFYKTEDEIMFWEFFLSI